MDTIVLRVVLCPPSSNIYNYMAIGWKWRTSSIGLVALGSNGSGMEPSDPLIKSCSNQWLTTSSLVKSPIPVHTTGLATASPFVKSCIWKPAIYHPQFITNPSSSLILSIEFVTFSSSSLQLIIPQSIDQLMPSLPGLALSAAHRTRLPGSSYSTALD